jgi:hypothetical protein
MAQPGQVEGFSVRQLRGGGIVLMHPPATFRLRKGRVFAQWDTPFAGPFQLDVSQTDVVDVLIAADVRSAVNGQRLFQLHLRLKDGRQVTPLRRLKQTKVARLHMELRQAVGLDPQTIEFPAQPTSLEPTPREADWSVPVPIAHVLPPPEPVSWVRGEPRSPGVRLRAGRLPGDRIVVLALLRLFPYFFPLFILSMMFFEFVGRARAQLLCIILLMALVARVAWSIWRFVQVANERYVVSVCERGIRFGTTRASGAAPRRRFVPIEHITEVAISEAWTGQRVLLQGWVQIRLGDGEMIRLLADRPRDEREWVAFELSRALEQFPRACAIVRPAPLGRSTALSYSEAARRHGALQVEPIRDSGVRIFVWPSTYEQVMRVVPWAAAAAVISTAAILGGGGWLLATLFSAPFVCGIIAQVLYWGQATELVLTQREMILDEPSKVLWRRRNWPRSKVRGVRLAPLRAGGGQQVVEIQLDGAVPLRLFETRPPRDQTQIVAALNELLEPAPATSARTP